jgi:hypothetical protein
MDRLNVGEWDKMIDVNIKGVLNGIAADREFGVRLKLSRWRQSG